MWKQASSVSLCSYIILNTQWGSNIQPWKHEEDAHFWHEGDFNTHPENKGNYYHSTLS